MLVSLSLSLLNYNDLLLFNLFVFFLLLFKFTFSSNSVFSEFLGGVLHCGFSLLLNRVVTTVGSHHVFFNFILFFFLNHNLFLNGNSFFLHVDFNLLGSLLLDSVGLHLLLNDFL